MGFMMLLSRLVLIGEYQYPTELSWGFMLMTVLRYMGSLSNNARKLANFAGFYKGIQSAGAAGMWR